SKVISVKADSRTFDINDSVFTLTTSGENSLLNDFHMPDTGGFEVIDLDKADDETFEKIEAELLASVGMFYLSNKPVIDAFIVKTD
ncbi:MAG: hypothetical protein Q7J78_01315, partial [Clostridiales bacterium]|nr:hypothetical protein [Clostridiales bacterium]